MKLAQRTFFVDGRTVQETSIVECEYADIQALPKTVKLVAEKYEATISNIRDVVIRMVAWAAKDAVANRKST